MLIAELLAISLWLCGQVTPCAAAVLIISSHIIRIDLSSVCHLQDVLRALLDFVVKLLVAHGSMVSFCLRRIVFCLVPPNPLLEAPAPGVAWQPPAEQAAVQDQIVHFLANVLLLVPTAPKAMLSELSQRMPFKFANRAAPCMYFRAVYQLSQTAAGECLRDGLQAVMVDCLLNIDVEIKWQDIADQQAGQCHQEQSPYLAAMCRTHQQYAPACHCSLTHAGLVSIRSVISFLPCVARASKSGLHTVNSVLITLHHADHVEDEHDSEDEQDVFALEGRQGQQLPQQVMQTLDEAAADPAISRGGWEGAAATQDVVPVASTSDANPIDETADSLDSLMELTFDHLVWRCQSGQLQRTWAVMLAAFERTLLHTYRSKFTQFLVYYMCQQVCNSHFCKHHMSL